MEYNYEELARFFQMFSDATRLKIIALLFEEEANVTTIAQKSGISISNVSHQLKDLKQQKIVKSRKAGKYIYYSLDDSHVQRIFQYGLEHITE